MKSDKRAYIFALSAVILWSTVATAFKITLRYTDPETMLFYASVTSLLIFTAVLILSGKLREAFKVWRKYPLYITLLGAINPFVYYLILFYAYSLLPAQEAQSINYTWGLLLAFLSVPVLDYKLGIRDIAGGIICYTGVLVIATHGDILSLHFYNLKGLAFAVASTLLWAIYWLYSVKIKDGDSTVLLFLYFLNGVVFVSFYMLLGGYSFKLDTYQAVTGILYTGFFEMGITFILWMKAMKYAENTAKISNLIYLSPFISLIFIHYIAGEEIMPSTLTALALIFTGLAIQKMRFKKRVSA